MSLDHTLRKTPTAVQEYETFELLVGDRIADGYPVTVTQSPAGEASGVCRLGLSADDIKDALQRIEADDTDERFLVQFGQCLFDALFVEQIAPLFRESVGLARGQNKGLRVRLRLEPPELAALPWEYACDGTEDCFLALSSQMPLVRYVPMAHPSRALAVRPPLRVLVILSSPSDVPPLNIEREESIIEEALRDWVDQGLVQLQFLEHGTVAGINQAMRSFRPHVFHFVGHGTYIGDEAYVMLEDKDGSRRLVGERTFREFFSSTADTRLAILNACQTAKTSSARPLTGVAPRLLQRNLSAVVAMQYPIPERTATTFTREFYRSLAQGCPVDWAMSEARKCVYMEIGGDLRDWGIPVLFMRAQDGRLFEWTEEEVQQEVPPPPEPNLPPDVSRLVGRETELAYFYGKLATSHLAVIAGMAGVGKTTLAVALAGRTAQPGSVFWHSFHEDEGVDAIIWKLAGFLYWQGQEELWRMLQSAQQTGSKPPPAETLFDYLFQMLRGQGYVLCLDDWHFVDDDPLLTQLVERVRPALEAGELSLIITSRRVPEFVPPGEYEALGGLGADDTCALLAARGISLPEELSSDLYDRTEGNAQLLTLAIEAMERSQHPERVIAHLLETEDIERYLMSEVDDGLAEEEREVMGAVAILLGYPGTRHAIEAVLGGASVRRILRELRDRHLLTAGLGEWGREYGQHAMVQEFFYDLPRRRERLEMHLRAGAYYEVEEPDALKAALHYERAGETERAAELATSDVWASINRGQAQALRSFLKQFRVQQLGPAIRAAVNVALGQIDTLSGESESAQASYEAAIKILGACADTSTTRILKARACRGLGELLEHESPKEALDWLHRGLAELGSSDKMEEAALYIKLGVIQGTLGDLDTAMSTTERGLELLPEGPSSLRASALLNQGWIYNEQGDLERFLASMEGSLDICEQLGDNLRIADTLNNRAITEYMSGKWLSAVADWERALEFAKKLGNVEQQIRLRLNLGFTYTRQGYTLAAHRHLVDSLELARKHNLKQHQIHIQSNLADLYLRQQDFEAAADALSAAEALAVDMEAKLHLPEVYGGWASLYLAQGDIQLAREYVEKSLKLARALSMQPEQGIGRRIQGQILLVTGQPESALVAFEESLSILAKRDTYEAARTKVQLGRCLLLSNDAKRGKCLLEEARITFQELGAKWDLTDGDSDNV